MGEEAREIERHIDDTRSRLDQNIKELEARAAEAADWRKQYQKSPPAALGIAFAGGFLISRLVGGKRRQQRVPEAYSRYYTQSAAPPTKTSGVLSGLQAAVITAVVHEAKEYLTRRFLAPLPPNGNPEPLK